jgi:hypothetical protein
VGSETAIMSKLAEFLKTHTPNANSANPANPYREISNISEISSETHANSDLSEACDSAPLSPLQDVARRAVLAQLEANPTVQRAFVNRFDETGAMVITLAIRGIGTGELVIPADRFNKGTLDDCGVLLAAIEGTA